MIAWGAGRGPADSAATAGAENERGAPPDPEGVTTKGLVGVAVSLPQWCHLAPAACFACWFMPLAAS